MAMKTKLAPVVAHDLYIVEYHHQHVVTTEKLATGYDASVKNIQDNFQNNRQCFMDEKHFLRMEGDELRQLKNRPEIIRIVGKNACSLILWTERTKAQIRCKHEVSAPGKLSSLTCRCRDLEEKLYESSKHATITKVEKAFREKK